MIIFDKNKCYSLCLKSIYFLNFVLNLYTSSVLKLCYNELRAVSKLKNETFNDRQNENLLNYLPDDTSLNQIFIMKID